MVYEQPCRAVNFMTQVHLLSPITVFNVWCVFCVLFSLLLFHFCLMLMPLLANRRWI